MPQNYKNSNLFSIDFEAIETVLEDANKLLLSKAEEIISKAHDYPDQINGVTEAEELKSFLAQLRLQTKEVAKARLSDGRPFSDASKVVKEWFGKIEDRLKAADKRASKALSSYATALHKQAEEIRQRNEEKQRDLQHGTIPIVQASDGKEIISAKPTASYEDEGMEKELEIPDVPLVWQVKNYDIYQLDLEKIKHHLSDYAIKNAINSYIKKHGPHQLSGVEYEQIVAKNL